MSFIKVKPTCPHCQRQFWRFKTNKNIKFCPHCQQSILSEKSDFLNGTFKLRTRLLISLACVCLVLITPYWRQSPILSQYSSIVGYLFAILLFSLLGYALLALVFFKQSPVFETKLKRGVDDWKTVTNQDLGEYYIGTHGMYVHEVTECPKCSSQRLQATYWFKINLAKQHANISAPKFTDAYTYSDKFLGCLNCHSQFMKEDKQYDYKSWLNSALLLTLIILNLFDLPATFANRLNITVTVAEAITTGLFVFAALSVSSSIKPRTLRETQYLKQ